jgi:hypothetical protein
MNMLKDNVEKIKKRLILLLAILTAFSGCISPGNQRKD